MTIQCIWQEKNWQAHSSNRTAEGLNFAREKKLFATQCPAYVEQAAECVERLLQP